jgi:hypothetical protein
MMAAIPGPALAVRESFPKQMTRSLEDPDGYHAGLVIAAIVGIFALGRS